MTFLYKKLILCYTKNKRIFVNKAKMMLCLPTDISENTNPQTKRLLRILKILCGLQIILGILLLLFVDIITGIWMIFGSFLFMLVIWMKNWCMSIMFIVFCLMELITSIFIVGSYFSENSASDNDTIYVILYMIKFPFFFVVIYYNFLAYRELKGLFIEAVEQGGIRNYGSMDTWYERNQRQEPPPPPPQPQPFSGPGYRLE